MKKREADFSILFRHWLRANPMHTCAFEMKQTTSDRFEFNKLEPHQENYLKAIKHGNGTLTRVQGINGEPDYIYMNKAPAYAVIKFPLAFLVIDIDAYSEIKEKLLRIRRKSMLFDEGLQIASYAHLFNHIKNPLK